MAEYSRRVSGRKDSCTKNRNFLLFQANASPYLKGPFDGFVSEEGEGKSYIF